MTSENPLDKKPDRDEVMQYRAQIMEEAIKAFNGPDEPHILDVLYDMGVPRQWFLCNLENNTFYELWEKSQGRVLQHPVENSLGDLAGLRDRAAQSLTMSGLDDKLMIMAALADPTTTTGQMLLMDLAKMRNSLLPKKTEVKQTGGGSVEDRELREELARIRRQREELLAQQDEARDTSWEPREPEGE